MSESADTAVEPGADLRFASEVAAEPSRHPWAELRAALQADRAHWRRRGCPSALRHRGYHAVWLYRLSRYAHERGWRMAAWFLWLMNGWWTGADIPPSSRIGGGLFLPHPYGTILAGAIGSDAAIGFQASIGGLLKAPDRDVGGGPGLPRIGDGVTLEPASLVLGAIRVGDRARIGPRCLVLKDVEADAEVQPPDWRALPGRRAAS